MAVSLDFAQRFDAYVRDAADFLQGQAEAKTTDDLDRLDGVKKVRDLVAHVRSNMPV